MELQRVMEFFRNNRHRLVGKDIIYWFVDNKSAVNILNNGVTDDERFLSWLSELPPNIKFFHISGSKNYIADTLSRDIQHTDANSSEGREGEINSVAAKRNRGKPKKISKELELDDENDEENNLTSNQKLFIQKLHEKGHFCYKKIYHLLDENLVKIKEKWQEKN